MAAICGLLGSSCEMAPDWILVAGEFGLQPAPQGIPLACTSSGQLWCEPEHHPRPHASMTHQKRRLRRHQSPAKVNPAPKSQSLCNSSSTSHWPVLTFDKPKGQSLQMTCKQKPRLNYNRRVQIIQKKDTPEHPSLVTRENAPLNPTRPTALSIIKIRRPSTETNTGSKPK